SPVAAAPRFTASARRFTASAAGFSASAAGFTASATGFSASAERFTASAARFTMAAAAIVLLALPAVSFAQRPLETYHVQGNVHMLVGAGANIAVQVGDDGVLVVDTGTAARRDDVLAAIRRL